jgi:hypothetical protein
VDTAKVFPPPAAKARCEDERWETQIEHRASPPSASSNFYDENGQNTEASYFWVKTRTSRSIVPINAPENSIRELISNEANFSRQIQPSGRPVVGRLLLDKQIG